MSEKTRPAFSNGSELFFYDKKTATILKCLIQGTEIISGVGREDVVYTLSFETENGSVWFKIEQRALEYGASKDKKEIIERKVLEFKDRIRLCDEGIKNCQEELREIQSIKENLEKTILGLQA